VPNLLLQPLVENAIRHGVGPLARPGRIDVRACRRGGELQLEVRDTGLGLPPDRLIALNKGVGLANTRARLEYLYGASHQCVFSNIEGGGFSVRVAIPFSDHRASRAPADGEAEVA
jgi:sensor histidine kinase YesM